jgi:hypothetical protein
VDWLVLASLPLRRLFDRFEQFRGDRFDLDTDEDEPVLAEMNEGLNRVDDVQRDRSRGIKPFPVVEGVAVITEDRRPIENSC